jgi:hypothetical protein
MMPSETQQDRQYYVAQFERLYERLDEIKDEIAGLRLSCSQRHARDCEVLSMMQGNGHPALAVRLDRLEQSEPRKEKSWSMWMAIAAMGTAIASVLIDWLRK